MQLIRLLATFTAVLLGGHLLSSCGGKTSPKSSGGNEGPSGPTSEIELSGSIADEAPVDFVQSSNSVSVGQVNLTDATSYVVKAYSLDPSGSKNEIFKGSFAEPKFSFKSTVARQYMLIEITSLPDGGQFGAVLPPPTSNKQASLVVDGATTIAAKMASLIASKAESGDQGARQALTSGSVSVADLLMVAQSVRTTVIEQREQNKGSAIDLSSLAANLVSKSNERISKLNAEGQSGTAVAEKLSEASYKTIFGDDAKAAPAGVLAYRVNPDLGSSEAANTTVAYEAIKASVSDSTKAVDEAFRAEATAYRTATSTAAAVAAKTTVADAFKEAFNSCMSSPSNCAQASYTPPKPPSSSLSTGSGGGSTTGSSTGGNTGSTPMVIPVITINTQPSNQTASGGSATFTVAASVTENATLSYQWQKQESVSGAFNNVGTNSATLHVSSLTNADDNNDVYRVIVSATGDATSVTSNPATLTMPAEAPGVPTAVTGTAAGNNQVSLKWNAPANTGGSAITGYSIQHSSNEGSTWSAAISTGLTSTSHTVTGLTNGTAYVFQVAAVNAVGTGSYSGPSAGVTPGPWTDVTVGSDITMRDDATGLWWSNYRGAMDWDAAMSHCGNLSYNGQGAGSWRVPTKNELMAAYNNGINTQGRTGWITNFNTWFWSSVSNDDSDYAWLVRLADGSSADSYKDGFRYQVVCVTNPDIPAAVTGTAGNTEVVLSWNAPANTGGSAITGYAIQHSSNGGSTWPATINTGSTSTSHTVTGLTNRTAYLFRVAAVNALGAGMYSGPSASVTPGNWTDVTVGSDKTMRDNATGLWWSNYRGAMEWGTAMSHCGNLSYNGKGAGSWRVPTVNELVAAYNNGINTQGRTGWITNFTRWFWSSVSNSSTGASMVSLASDNATNYVKTSAQPVVCVRQP